MILTEQYRPSLNTIGSVVRVLFDYANGHTLGQCWSAQWVIATLTVTNRQTAHISLKYMHGGKEIWIESKKGKCSILFFTLLYQKSTDTDENSHETAK